ncbi:DEAD/DEAH box helicase [Sphingomonas endophytica]|uniref:DEAD/DEAH box helicase n=1 Tax=Sphingomonas endophytica TaxID=869719 RepID=UPI000736281C|nr:DEAD/DEAH box helicase family protein [Sphingomonas endophytica]
MRLKDYQEDTLAALDHYVAALAAARDAAEPAVAAWGAVQAAGVAASPDPWRPLRDGHGAQVPHVCLALPTGSGKTLIAGHAVGRILSGLGGAATGLVLWMVPSEAIYRQTRAQLRDRAHPLRQALEVASGGRVTLLEKGSDIARADVEGGLAVMLLMLHAARQTKDTSEQKALKVFRESGRYRDFFPEGDDRAAAQALAARVPNLETHDLPDGAPGAIVQSLGNLLRLVRPLIVLDEGHTAYSVDRRRLLGAFNPRFLLELTATPSREHSNILVRVGGRRLRDAEMIRLPIELVADADAPWKDTLKAALDQRAALERLARANGAPIRPIMLVRVELTGRDQREKGKVHTEDAVEALVNEMGVPPEWIRRQTAVDRELDDQLLSDASPVRIIVTKDALREGWDCPFAYVLALLGSTRARTALTQMIGRVLRQPGARRTGVSALDSAWVFCRDISVRDAVAGIRAGLDEEGLGDLETPVRAAGAPGEARTIARGAAWRDAPIALPVVTHDDGTGTARALDVERDILAAIDWSALRYVAAAPVVAGGSGATRRRIDDRGDAPGAAGMMVDERIDRPDLARRLLDVVPNPWVAITLVDRALAALRAQGIDEATIARGRLALVADMRVALSRAVDAAARAVFLQKLAAGTIAIRPDDAVAIPAHVTVPVRARGDGPLTDDRGAPLARPLFPEAIGAGELNAFAREVALSLDRADAVDWWWPLPARGAWGVRGWRRQHVRPDFVVRAGGRLLVLLLEAGGRPSDDDDAAYRRALMAALQDVRAVDARGSRGNPRAAPAFTMLMQDEDWRSVLAAALRL